MGGACRGCTCVSVLLATMYTWDTVTLVHGKALLQQSTLSNAICSPYTLWPWVCVHFCINF